MEAQPTTMSDRDWIPYVAPMAAFLLLTAAEAQIPTVDGRADPTWYPLAYAGKVLVVAVVTWLCRSAWRDLRPLPGAAKLAASVALGFVVTALWVGLSPITPALPLLGGGRSGFDPGAMTPAGRAAFLAVRFLGLVALVPLIEELFWRSFLLRWLIDQDFRRVPIGKVTPMAAVVSSVMFAAVHPEWLAALLTGFLWVGLLAWTRSIAALVVSHAAANLGLGLYVLATGEWKYL